MWNEIKDRAIAFANEWEGEYRERAEKDSFWNDFFQVFGKNRRSLDRYEHAVKKLGNKQGFVDLFWEGTLLVEHKSRGKNLDSAFGQALDYFPGLSENQLPKYVVVSDFEYFRLYNLDEWNDPVEFHIKDLHTNVHHFGFIAGYQKREFKDQDPVNVNAARNVCKLYDSLKESGYDGEKLEWYLVRLVFCFYAEDTAIFERDIFRELIERNTSEDGRDLGQFLAHFFQQLNTLETKRSRNLDETLISIPYVNGGLFEENLPIADFNSTMRTILIDCCALDWGQVSPAIFGSMFQNTMDSEKRRNLGAHYTSEKNILKIIGPLFLNDLKKKFDTCRSNKNKLRALHQEITDLTFLDPACGCGNFLIIAYREVRRLELEIVKILQGTQQVLDISTITRINLNQFNGIEIESMPAKIAKVSMWIMEHQMNRELSDCFGYYFNKIPLTDSVNIVTGNALQIEWGNVVSKDELDYILGNPPFVSHHNHTEEQK